MAELINKEDNLNQGRVKINTAIKDAGDALNNANQALEILETTQTEIGELGENLAYQMPVTNEISNSNFEDISGWIGSTATLAISNNKLKMSGNGLSAGPSVYTVTGLDNTPKKLFGKIKLTVNSPNVARIRVQVRGTNGGMLDFYDKDNPAQGVIDAYGAVDLDGRFSGEIRFYIVTVFNSLESASIGHVLLEKALLVDLTKTFGRENEPNASDFYKMLSRYPNKWFEGITGPLLSLKDFFDYYYRESEPNILRAFPKNLLQYEVIEKPLIPISIGFDGGVYGMRGLTGANRIHRTFDGYNTSEDGFDFSPLLETGDYLTYVCQMPGGYVVVASNSSNYTAKVFHSESFTDGFNKVLDIPNGLINSWGVAPPIFEYGRGLLMLSEYAQDSTDKYVYITKDGGATWQHLIKNDVKDPAERCHWHSATFDNARSRFYVSQGDNTNTKLKYSDDLGQTWHEIVYDLDTPLQPTVMPILNDRIIYSPDRAAYPVSIWQSDIDQSMETFNDPERFEVYHAYTITTTVGAHKQFGGYPIINTGSEMIMSFADRGANNQRTYFVATGDGGNTWHNIFTFDWSGSNGAGGAHRGIVGYDKNGYMYIHTQFDGEHRILKCPPIEWLYS